MTRVRHLHFRYHPSFDISIPAFSLPDTLLLFYSVLYAFLFPFLFFSLRCISYSDPRLQHLPFPPRAPLFSIFHLLNRLPPSLCRAPPTVTPFPIPHSDILPLDYFSHFSQSFAMLARLYFFHIYVSVVSFVLSSRSKSSSCKQCCLVDKCILKNVFSRGAPYLRRPPAKLCLTSRRLHNPLNDPV